jgi:UDP-N-acetylglucosamine 2-epimerase (non-hydrolysing)
MRVLIVLGTRPEIIRLSRVISRLDGLCELVVVHTGQNFDELLSDVFFRDLGVRAPDHHLGITGGSFAGRVGRIFEAVDELIDEVRPDRMLVLGDTDSAMSAYVAKRRGVPVFHMEAGNRCFDDRVPEEVNRRLIDHASDILMPYTERSRKHLLDEGFALARILVTGNPIKEVLDRHADAIAAASPLGRLGLDSGGYLLLTLHRQETVDDESRLRSVLAGAQRAAEAAGMAVLFSAHPRTRERLSAFGIVSDGDWLVSAGPLPFFEFVACEQQAACVLTDSGTVQEECCIFGVPAVTVRDSTERLETIECGSNILSGIEPAAIERCTNVALSREHGWWEPPPEYLAGDVSATVCSILLGHPTAGTAVQAPTAPG